MDNRPRPCTYLTGLVLAIATLATIPAIAAAQPASINNLVSNTEPFTAPQRRAIEDYATYWSAALSSQDMEQARLAKRRLTEPFRSPGIRRIFRDEYARAAIPGLRRHIESDNVFAGVNAMQIVAEFQSDTALSVARDRCDIDREPRWQIRLWAAQAFGRIASQSEDIPDRTIDSAMRDLARAGERETHWLVLQRQFEAMAAVSSDQSRESQIALLKTTLERITSEPSQASDLIQPVHRAMVLLRDQYLDVSLSSDQRNRLAADFAPLLREIQTIDIAQWNDQDVNRDVRTAYESAQSLSDTLLALLR